MSDWLEIPVEQVKGGDDFISGGRYFWTATQDAEVVDTEHGKLVRISVQHADGGREDRHWDPGTILGVERHER